MESTIKDYCIKYPELSDREIALKLLKLKAFSRYNNGLRCDALRRRVGDVRLFYNLRPPKNRVTNKDIKAIIKKYPDASNFSLAKKLQISFPNYTAYTLREMIRTYKKYEY